MEKRKAIMEAAESVMLSNPSRGGMKLCPCCRKDFYAKRDYETRCYASYCAETAAAEKKFCIQCGKLFPAK